MERRLIVLRHAKSDWNAGASNDHERPINARGQRDAPVIGQRLRTRGWVPDCVISSDATRTRQTWEGMHEALGGTPTVRFCASLYLGGQAELERELSTLSGACQTVMVIGHNPGWQEAVSALSGVHVQMTTCNAALLWIESMDWVDAVHRCDWMLDTIIRPKDRSS